MKSTTSIISKEQFFDILNTILTTHDINELLTYVVEEVRKTINADRCTLYLINKETHELYSKVLQAKELVEIRLPIDKTSLAGYCAIMRKIVVIKDAYDDKELSNIDKDLVFDKSWDTKSGYKTKSVLIIPIPDKVDGQLLGVFQALNKEGGFTKNDLDIIEQLTYLLGIAVKNAFLYQMIEQERILREYIMDDIEEGICIVDTKFNIVSANRFIETMSGMRFSISNMIGVNFFDIFTNLEKTELQEKMIEVLEKGYKMVANLPMVEVKVIPYHDDSGKVSKIILIFTRSL
ncbi:MAG: GAF domain-containing protein [Thermodesulfovibrionales bacterium]|nr:GAF domain-containing protein [Thermodesulfovibrionales bacterium]